MSSRTCRLDEIAAFAESNPKPKEWRPLSNRKEQYNLYNKDTYYHLSQTLNIISFILLSCT